MRFKQSKLYLPLIIIIASFLSFWNIGKHDISEWDESRNGVNAYEMYHNKDFINYYFNSKPDTWNAKPPLMIWSIVASYHLFGFNEFALRFPSAISAILFFFFFFLLIRLFGNEKIAFFTCLVLLSSRAVIGYHIGLSGDFDAMLLMFITASVYQFALYSEKNRISSLYLMALFTGLAIYTKGTAALIFIPGFFFYLLFFKQFKKAFVSTHFWLSSLLLVFIIFSWVFLVLIFGNKHDDSFYGSKNPVETMLVYDTFERMTNPSFSQESNHDFAFLISATDIRLNLWNYLFYIAVVTGIYLLIKNRKNIFTYLRTACKKSVVLFFFLTFPICLILTFSTNQLNWYLAPVYPFIAFIAIKGFLYFAGKFKYLYIVFFLLSAFTLCRHFYYIHNLPDDLHNYFTSGAIKHNTIYTSTETGQHILLYLKWQNITTPELPLNKAANYKNEYFMIKKSCLQYLDQPYENIEVVGDNILLKIK